MIKSFLQRLAIKYLGLQDLSVVQTTPVVTPSVRVISSVDAVDASTDATTLNIKIDPVVNAQLEAESCIRAMQSMISFYRRNNGDVDAFFSESCVMLMTSAQITVQRLSQLCEHSKS